MADVVVDTLSHQACLPVPLAPVVAVDIPPAEKDQDGSNQVQHYCHVGSPQPDVLVEGVSPQDAVRQIGAEDSCQDIHAEWDAKHLQGERHHEGHVDAGRLDLALLVEGGEEQKAREQHYPETDTKPVAEVL